MFNIILFKSSTCIDLACFRQLTCAICDLVPIGVEEKRTEVLENRVDRM